ncbi:hypothetical protein AaE_008120 [Aphanomyces astaci]|uniref:USP domain-containing protein n=1 Tax=Aphanomyces astaci TaxID=112090 RepID=A0A6A5AFQ3_APHAT|nr:hypothetical protein AaE_008120 [Aphanomyces astaci]
MLYLGLPVDDNLNVYIRSIVLKNRNWKVQFNTLETPRDISSFEAYMSKSANPELEKQRMKTDYVAYSNQVRYTKRTNLAASNPTRQRCLDFAHERMSFIGIQNPLQFTCYQNVIYQSLFALGTFEIPGSVEPGSALSELREDMKTMHYLVQRQNPKVTLLARPIYEILQLPKHVQQDCMEFFMLLLATTDDEETVGPWRSRYITRLTCTDCPYRTTVEEQGNVFIMPCGDFVSVTAEIQKYLEFHNHSFVERDCAMCTSKRAIRVQIYTSMAPILCIQFSRFQFDGTGQKALGRPTFDKKIDFNETTVYLTSIILHLGSSLESGHYVCYCRVGTDIHSTWHYINDAKVQRIGTFEALKVELKGHLHEVYVLIYS